MKKAIALLTRGYKTEDEYASLIQRNKSIEEKTQISKADLLSRIYSSRNPKNYIASFAKIVKYYENESVIQDIITSSFLIFMEKNPYQYFQYQKYQFGFAGSIAFYFKTHIENILK